MVIIYDVRTKKNYQRAVLLNVKTMMTEVEIHAQHAIRKYLMATVMSVIQSKPAGINIKDYCYSIQAKIKNDKHFDITNYSQDSQLEINLENLTELNGLNSSISTQDLLTQEQLRKFDSSDAKKRTKLNLKMIHAIGEIQNVINYQKGNNLPMSQESFCESLKDSGFTSERSQKFVNEGYKLEKKINDIDQSLSILINFLRETSNDQSQDCLHHNISRILGTAVDILYEQKIHMPSINKCVDIINNTIDNILNTANKHMTETWRNEFKSLYGLNDSLILIQQTIRMLCNHLNNYLSKLNLCDREIQPPETIDILSIIFTMIEELLDKYSAKKTERKDNISIVDVSIGNESQVVSSENKIIHQNWNLSSGKPNNNFNLEEFESFIANTLNQIALECIETYPLFSFWAMECANIKKD